VVFAVNRLPSVCLSVCLSRSYIVSRRLDRERERETDRQTDRHRQRPRPRQRDLFAPRLRNDLYCVEWDVKLYYAIPYHTSKNFPTTCTFCVEKLEWCGYQKDQKVL